jgi:hypothetical protein
VKAPLAQGFRRSQLEECLLHGRGLLERVRDHIADEREVTVEFGVRPLNEDDLGRDEIARLQVEGVRELDKAGVTEKDRPMRRLDLLREPLEVGQEGDRSRLLIDDRRGPLTCPAFEMMTELPFTGFVNVPRKDAVSLKLSSA